MFKLRFEPIAGKSAEIIEKVMSSEDISSEPALEFKLRLCIEEVVENIVNYAYERGNGFMEVGTSREDGVLEIYFKDGGVEFNPLDAPDPDITLSADDRPIGGLGIFICKKLMDEMSYSYENGFNVLRMKKRVN
ncbi:MAG: ATP-binding protein [Bacteroidaceae bacterium]|nr:ATP-binding protein [Bacteroidaceae bacterium]